MSAVRAVVALLIVGCTQPRVVVASPPITIVVPEPRRCDDVERVLVEDELVAFTADAGDDR